MATDDLIFQHYLVVFMDQLGQRNRLRKITELPSSDADKDQFIQLMNDSVGRVIKIREMFKDYFDSANLHATDLTQISPEDRDEFLSTQKFDIKFYGLSDAVIMAVPLMNTDENCTAVNGIYSAFVATCGIGLFSLSAKVPMRAGLDVGIATQIDETEVYGPALERAYYLESQLAEGPRFLIGPELLSYLNWVKNQECKTRIGQVSKALAKYCLDMIIRDTDGRFMLDFLGEKIKEMTSEFVDKELINSALEFVETQHSKYLKEENDKLASRYYRLLRYFHSRKKLWGIN